MEWTVGAKKCIAPRSRSIPNAEICRYPGDDEFLTPSDERRRYPGTSAREQDLKQ